MKLKTLVNEMNKKGITRKDLAALLNKSYKTICNKLSGKTAFMYNEMRLIKNTYFPDYTMDYIFDTGFEYMNKIKRGETLTGPEMYAFISKIVEVNNLNVTTEELEVQRKLLVG